MYEPIVSRMEGDSRMQQWGRNIGGITIAQGVGLLIQRLHSLPRNCKKVKPSILQ